MTDERTHECERCGQAYTASYGRWHTTSISSRWYCHPCADEIDKNRRTK